MAPHIANFLLGSFGIVAAILLVGGSIVLRAQQNRHRFELAKKSLESGVPLPTPAPLWATLRRQAQSTLAVGVGLLIVGFVAWGIGAKVERPAQASVQAPPPAADAPAGGPLDGPHGTPRDGPGFGPGFGRPTPPPPPSPEVQAWQSAQERVAVGQTAMGCGVILTLLGATRLAAAKTERAAGLPPG